MSIDLSYGLTPYLPSDTAINRLRGLAYELAQHSAHLAGQVPWETASALGEMLSVINSYYSNRIEGQGTHPVEIEAAFKAMAAGQPDHLVDVGTAITRVERQLPAWIINYPNLSDTAFITQLHREAYSHLGQEHLTVKYDDGRTLQMVPGELREVDVAVGHHVACKHSDVKMAMATLSRHMRVAEGMGELGILTAATAHHRLLWIHPFVDGNGRVARLYSHACLMRVMRYAPLWSLSRGLARNKDEYYRRLIAADAPRQGDYDGRGSRSEKGLIEWIDFFLDCMRDQMQFMSTALDLEGYRKRVKKFVEVYCDGTNRGFPKLHPKSHIVLVAAYSQGSIGRGDVPAMVNLAERMSRLVTSELLEAGLLYAESPRASLKPRFPAKYLEYLFPGLGPAAN